tara:strand:- start:3771 stop:5027 length:1257 start_codon:yes stop_codon:yes gene_type:complete
MKSLKLAAIFLILLLSGCSITAGISRGQELRYDVMPSVLIENDNMRDVFESTVRIRAKDSRGSVMWMGSGNVYRKENGRLFILSNNHVCDNPKGSITVQFILGGKQTIEYKVRVDLCVEENGVDVAVVSLPHGRILDKVPVIPIREAKIETGQQIFHVGCDAGHPQNAQIGEVQSVSENHFLFWPSAYPGDSGSSIVHFDEDGEGYIVGLVAWQAGLNGKTVGMAMKSSVVLDVLDGGKIPNLPDRGDVPPSNLDNERFVQSLLDRLRELKENNSREREGLLNRLSEMQTENAMQRQEAQLFRDMFKKKQDEQLKKEDSIQDKLLKQFTLLSGAVKLLKWSFYGLIGLLVAALFFKQGWATTVIICVITFIFRTIKLAYLLIHKAIVAKVNNPKTMSEALEDLQDGISEGIGRRGDEP